MKITPRDIARSLVDSIAASAKVSVSDACDSAIRLLKRSCPGTTRRRFLKIVEHEMRKQGKIGSGLLMVPSTRSLEAKTIQSLLQAKTGKPVHIDRAVEPELIGGAVLLIDHRRIDCSIQGALAALLRTCLQPLD